MVEPEESADDRAAREVVEFARSQEVERRRVAELDAADFPMAAEEEPRVVYEGSSLDTPQTAYERSQRLQAVPEPEMVITGFFVW